MIVTGNMTVGFVRAFRHLFEEDASMDSYPQNSNYVFAEFEEDVDLEPGFDGEQTEEEINAELAMLDIDDDDDADLDDDVDLDDDDDDDLDDDDDFNDDEGEEEDFEDCAEELTD